VAGATIVLVYATILYQTEHRRPAPWPSTSLLLSVNSNKPSCLAQRALAGALPDRGDDGGTADRGQRQHDECKDAVLQSDAGQLPLYSVSTARRCCRQGLADWLFAPHFRARNALGLLTKVEPDAAEWPSCDPPSCIIDGEWQWLVRQAGRDVAEGVDRLKCPTGPGSSRSSY
jgi:hypothetical protein